MRILGIDPGIGRTGWGVIDSQKGKVVPISYGCIETPSTDSISERLFSIHTIVLELIKDYRPESMAIEDLFFNTNAKTAFIVGQARGVILLAAGQSHMSISVYTPLQVKVAVSGYGRAEKNQIGQMIKTILQLPSIPKPDDTADALAIALTHAFSKKW